MESSLYPNITLVFHGDTREVLNTSIASDGRLEYRLTRKASIKDIIEALGLPHTEIGRLLCGPEEIDFGFIPAGGEIIDIHPGTAGLPVTVATRLRPEPLDEIRFITDITLGKLTRLLRMTGLDVIQVQATPISDIAAEAAATGRILLSRNRDVLKLRIVAFGRLVRSVYPKEQLREVIDHFDLAGRLQPFCRCLNCNTLLQPVAKEKISDRLEPLTRRYYNSFQQCTSCHSIYWRGSHHRRMADDLRMLTGKSASSA